MSGSTTSIFLERQFYRRRRLVDWIRLIPILGLGLWAIPLLWPTDGETPVSTADGVIFIFAVWFLLVVVSAVSISVLARAEARLKDTDLDQKDT